MFGAGYTRRSVFARFRRVHPLGIHLVAVPVCSSGTPARKTIGGKDVLLAEPDERLLVLTEMKDFRAGLVLSTLRDELGAFGEALAHLRERTAWVRAHLQEVAAELGIVPADTERWAVPSPRY